MANTEQLAMCKWLEHEVDQEQIGMQRIIMHCPSRFVEND
jgi:hypothetical protein